MALNFRNAEANLLAAEVNYLAGETTTDALILALQERLPRQRDATPRKDLCLANHLVQIALRCAARPIRDPRSAEEIWGYDAIGQLY